MLEHVLVRLNVFIHETIIPTTCYYLHCIVHDREHVVKRVLVRLNIFVNEVIIQVPRLKFSDFIGQNSKPNETYTTH